MFYIYEHIYLWVTFYNVTFDVDIRFLGQHRRKIMLMVYEPEAGSYNFSVLCKPKIVLGYGCRLGVTLLWSILVLPLYDRMIYSIIEVVTLSKQVGAM